MNEKNQTKEICMKLINTNENVALLKEIPNFSFGDLSLIFVLHKFMISEQIIDITLMDSMSLNADSLLEIAFLNYKQRTRPIVTTIRETILPMATKEEMELFDNSTPTFPMYCATNNNAWNGAVVMLDNDFLTRFSKQHDFSFYILPSSIHEVLFVPAPEDVEQLEFMVRDVNQILLSKKEFLSNNIYFFDKDTLTISLAKDKKPFTLTNEL